MNLNLRRENVLFAVFWLLLWSFGSRLEASCCSSASSGGVARLLAHERAVLEVSSHARYQMGAFSDQARFSFGHAPHLPHLIFEKDFHVIARVFDFFEPFVRVPIRVQQSARRTHAGLADVKFGARFPLFKEHALPHWPAMSLIASTSVPTGSSKKDKAPPEGITSNGEWLTNLGILLEKDFHRVIYGVSYAISAEGDYFESSASSGLIHEASLSAGILPHDTGFLTASLGGVFHAPMSSRGTRVIDTDRRKISLSLSYVLTLHSHLKVNAQLGSDLPINALGKNFSSDLFLRLGMRIGIF